MLGTTEGLLEGILGVGTVEVPLEVAVEVKHCEGPIRGDLLCYALWRVL